MSDRPARIALSGDRVAPHAREWLGGSAPCRIHSLYLQALNLVDGRGEMLAIVLPPLGPGPFALRLDPAPDGFVQAGGFVGLLHPDVPVRRRPGWLELGPLAVSLTGLRSWNPRPDWGGLRRSLGQGTIEGLEQRLGNLAPAGSLAPLAAVGPGRRGKRWVNEPRPAPWLEPIAGRTAGLLGSLARSDPDRLARAASQLAGLGAGVTPAGDDYLVGAIHALWARRGSAVAGELSRAIAEAAVPRTNAVSAAWLRAAARGEAADEWHSLFREVVQGGPLGGAARQLIRRGHTSGADGLAGFLAAWKALAPAPAAQEPLGMVS